MREDASCLAYSASHGSSQAVLVAVFPGPQPAAAHHQRVRSWTEAGEGPLGCDLASVISNSTITYTATNYLT